MSEVKRWTLWRTTDMQWVSGDNDDIGGPVRVREDQATEVDREKVAYALAERAAQELELDEVEVLPFHLETADELLSLVFGEEASRG